MREYILDRKIVSKKYDESFSINEISKEISLEKRITKINNKLNNIIKSTNHSETEFSSYKKLNNFLF
jgi:hypothetical protein